MHRTCAAVSDCNCVDAASPWIGNCECVGASTLAAKPLACVDTDHLSAFRPIRVGPPALLLHLHCFRCVGRPNRRRQLVGAVLMLEPRACFCRVCLGASPPATAAAAALLRLSLSPTSSATLLHLAALTDTSYTYLHGRHFLLPIPHHPFPSFSSHRFLFCSTTTYTPVD